jgi:L-iditol 2-dehydrogenase
MKALCLMGSRRMEIAEVPAPQQVGPADVLVRVKAIGICGSDLHYYRGEPAGNSPLAYPFIMGHEFAGVIEAVGDKVTNVRVGDRVAVDPACPCGHCEYCLEGNPNFCTAMRFSGSPGVEGAMQELVVWPSHTAFKLPNGMSFATGAALEPLGVALHAINLAKIRVADSVAVIGAGPIGLMIAELARLSGAQDVFVTDVLEHRVRMAERLGFTAINAGKVDQVKTIWKATNGRGVDVALEAAGAVESPEQAAEMAKAGANVVIVGICGEDRMDFRAGVTRRKGLTIKVSRRMKHVYNRTIPLVNRNMVDLNTIMTHTYPLEKGADAFRAAADYEVEAGKVILLNGEQ